MKRIFVILCFVFIVCISLMGCDYNTNQLPPAGSGSGNTTDIIPEQPSEGDCIKQPIEPDLSDKREITKMYITINRNKLEVTLAENSSVDALVEVLKQGDIVYTADDYGNFEKVGNIGYMLPKNDKWLNTEAGDVILYQGNQICLYYGNNSWSFTRIGKISGYSVSELKLLLCAGSGIAQVIISLA